MIFKQEKGYSMDGRKNQVELSKRKKKKEKKRGKKRKKDTQ